MATRGQLWIRNQELGISNQLQLYSYLFVIRNWELGISNQLQPGYVSRVSEHDLESQAKGLIVYFLPNHSWVGIGCPNYVNNGGGYNYFVVESVYFLYSVKPWLAKCQSRIGLTEDSRNVFYLLFFWPIQWWWTTLIHCFFQANI